MTQARWQDRACATSVRANVWLGLAFGFGALELGTGCEVVGEIGADDLAASTSTSSTGDRTDDSSGPGTTADATKPTVTTESSSSSSADESSSGDDPDTFRLDVGNGVSETMTTESTDAEDSSTSPPDDLDSSSSGAGGDAPPCCEAAMEPGCVDPELEACVCAADEFCCAEQWDAACVDVAMFGDCGAVCENMPLAPEPGDCCAPNDASPGCVDPEVQDCVCAVDPYCCAYAWDDVCVDYVEQYECGTCG